MISIKNNSNSYSLQLLAMLAIIFSFTGSGIVFFKIFDVAVTPMRIIGTISLIYSLIKLLLVTKKPIYECYLFILVLYIIVASILFSENPINSIKLILDYVVGTSIFNVIVASCKSLKIYKNYYMCYLVSLIGTMGICIYEFLTNNHIAENYSTESAGLLYSYLSKAPTAFLYNPNNIGVLMILSMPFLYLLPKISNKKYGFTILNMLICTDIAIVLMTGSRGSFATVCFLGVFYIMFSNFKTYVKILTTIFAVCIVLYSQYFIFSQLLYGGMIENGGFSLFAAGDGGRLFIAKTALENVFFEKPLFGAGAGGVENSIGMSAHNAPVEILSNYGIIGAIIFICGFMGLLISTYKIKDIIFRKSLLLFLFCLLCSMFIPPTLMTLHFIWALMAMDFAYSRVEER